MLRCLALMLLALGCESRRPPRGNAEADSFTPESPQRRQRTTSARAFDLRAIRVDPHLIGQVVPCHVAAVGAVTTIDADQVERYPETCTHRVDVECAHGMLSTWVDAFFPVTRLEAARGLGSGLIATLKVRAAEGGHGDAPMVEFMGVSEASEQSLEAPSARPLAAPMFDLRTLAARPDLVGSSQRCSVTFAGDIEIVHAYDIQRRSYPVGVENRLSLRCRNTHGESWGDLVFFGNNREHALEVQRGDVISVIVLARAGGIRDYPVLLYSSEER